MTVTGTAVSGTFFEVLGARPAVGRLLREQDAAAGAEVVAVIGYWMTVIGIVGDLRYRDLDAPPPALYIPLRQTSFPPRFLIVRTSVTNTPVLSMRRRVVRQMDADEPVVEAASVATLLAGELAAPRFQLFALGLFALLAILLAGVGVFAILAAFVAHRSREFGVRVALGATGPDLRRLVLSRMAWPAALGLTRAPPLQLRQRDSSNPCSSR